DNGFIVTSAAVRLEKGKKEQIKEKMYGFLARRKEKQPLEFPSAGSTFKRPQGYFAGALIEQCGLKGTSIGGAQVSEKHAGFVINRGGATADDVLRLVELVAQTVEKETGVRLEPEIRFIG
ncbi:MAG: UDP-N-acetylenolpyruvoylglucosamine reductase, partial [Acutalibacteraceae bacterium]